MLVKSTPANCLFFQSIFFGRCYSIYFLEENGENDPVQVFFNKEVDLQIYLHLKEEEFWLSVFEFPKDVLTFRIKAKQVSKH